MGRQWVNIHGSLGHVEMQQVRDACERINAGTKFALFKHIKGALPEARTVHLFLDTARYHNAKMLKPWLERPECRLKLHFLPLYPPPHLNPIRSPLGRHVHRHVTPNRFHSFFRTFAKAIDAFFDAIFPEMRGRFRSTVTDNFRAITHDEYSLIGPHKYHFNRLASNDLSDSRSNSSMVQSSVGG